MLLRLNVENLAVVEKATLDFSEKLNVLTGETGAGKSLLIDAVSLFINRKLPANIIRSGAEKVTVEALFVRGEEEYILRREADSARSLHFINGEMVPFPQLKETALALLTIYGQRDHVFLLNTANHAAYLDEFARHRPQLEALAAAAKAVRKRCEERRALQEMNQRTDERLEFLRFQIEEIERLDLQSGDDVEWENRARLLAAAEEIHAKANQAIEALYQQDQSAHALLAAQMPHLHYLAAMYPDFAPFRDRVEELSGLLPELAGFLHQRVESLEYDESELNKVQERLLRLNLLKSKYKTDLDGLLQRMADMKRESGTLQNLEFALQEKQKEIDAALAEYARLHSGLRESRRRAGERLGRAVEKELNHLAMKSSRFQIRLEEVAPDAETACEKGCDRVEFFFSSNPGQEPGPLAEVASGGELSRLMLVLKSLHHEESAATFIFDEVDSGVGGKTAEFIGEKLCRIAASNQVICISHLPQIASFADRHFLITKEVRAGSTYSTVRALNEAERVNEIARLMAGSVVNPEVLKAAESLLHKSRS